MENNILMFEGAGCVDCNKVGNCRIRTRIENNKGRVIYFEATSLKKNMEFIGFVSHCFDVKDQQTNHTKDLKHIEKLRFVYSNEGILKFINENLDCSFNKIKVRNEGLRVHDTEKPLCYSGEVA